MLATYVGIVLRSSKSSPFFLSSTPFTLLLAFPLSLSFLPPSCINAPYSRKEERNTKRTKEKKGGSFYFDLSQCHALIPTLRKAEKPLQQQHITLTAAALSHRGGRNNNSAASNPSVSVYPLFTPFPPSPLFPWHIKEIDERPGERTRPRRRRRSPETHFSLILRRRFKKKKSSLQLRERRTMREKKHVAVSPFSSVPPTTR